MTSDPSRTRAAASLALVAALAVVGTLVVLGCLLAVMLELDGFGRPRDTGPRAGYLVLLGAGAALGAVVPSAVAAVLLRGPLRLAGMLTPVVVLVLGVGVLGLSR